jgi:hypothetical protein
MNKRGITSVVMLLAVAAAVLVQALPASANRVHASHSSGVPTISRTVKFGRCHNSGKHASCASTGTVKNPLSIKFHVLAAPVQRVRGSWSVTCTKGKRKGHRQGRVRGLAPQKLMLGLPFPGADSCSVTASAQLRRRGALRTYLTATVSR